MLIGWNINGITILRKNKPKKSISPKFVTEIHFLWARSTIVCIKINKDIISENKLCVSIYSIYLLVYTNTARFCSRETKSLVTMDATGYSDLIISPLIKPTTMLYFYNKQIKTQCRRTIELFSC